MFTAIALSVLGLGFSIFCFLLFRKPKTTGPQAYTKEDQILGWYGRPSAARTPCQIHGWKGETPCLYCTGELGDSLSVHIDEESNATAHEV